MEEFKKIKEENQRLKEKILLLEKKSIFHNYFENNNVPMLCICPETKKILDANNSAVDFYGYDKKKLLSLRIDEINIMTDPEIVEKMEKSLGQKTNKYEFRHKLASGKIKDVLVFASPIKSEGKNLIITTIVDITGTKKQQKELFNKTLMLKEAQRISKVGFWERNIIADNFYWSDQVYEILEFDKTQHKASYRNFIKLIHPDDRSYFFRVIKNTALAELEVLEIEIKIIVKSGKKKYLNLSFYRELNDKNLISKIFGTVQDITISKEIELKLKKQNKYLSQLKEEILLKNKILELSKKRFRTLFDYSPISLWEEDYSALKKILKKTEHIKNFKEYLDNNPDFVYKCAQAIEITKVNQKTKQLFGIDSRHDFSLYVKKEFNEVSFETFKKELIENRAGKKNFSGETEFVLVNGKKIQAIIQSRLLEEENKVIISITDVTELKDMQLELKKAKEEAEKSNALKSEFLHNLSHEIRTPMNGIIGFSDILLTEQFSEEKRKIYLNIIKNSGNQLLKIIDDILDISRLETKHVKVRNKELCLNNLLFELFSIFDIKAKENKTPLYLNTQISDKESTIYSDSTKLNKIVGNLLENALKYTSEGSIEFGNYIRGNRLIIYVKDTGIGIKSENITKIFDRFSREENTLTKTATGLGLGLSIAKENTELLNGNLEVRSTEGKGSVFYLSLPYKKIIYNNENNGKISSQEQNIEAKKNLYNILIAEDEEVNFLYLKILLQQKLKINCHITHVINGLEALNQIKSNNKFDLILMDLKMPVMDGFEASSAIKKINKHVPIIAVTAYSSIDSRNKAINAGCDNYLSKPINNFVFEDIIRKYLN